MKSPETKDKALPLSVGESDPEILDKLLDELKEDSDEENLKNQKD